ncbi:hypothetical protein EVAR_37875_1 [Eumeta japonica]|uniref:Uncharacterized protein n=1 Tax=Eumeta variegata TaxID=151549 RepID=A0A4C1Y560_EUMVA|nr:hypothetical protein EVAR_37875_1 [Eumeta japonica]
MSLRVAAFRLECFDLSPRRSTCNDRAGRSSARARTSHPLASYQLTKNRDVWSRSRVVRLVVWERSQTCYSDSWLRTGKRKESVDAARVSCLAHRASAARPQLIAAFN